MKVRSTYPLCRSACAAPAQSPGNAATVCLWAVECHHTSLWKAAWQTFTVVSEDTAFVRPHTGNSGLFPWDEQGSQGCCHDPAVLVAFGAAANPSCFGDLYPARAQHKTILKKQAIAWECLEPTCGFCCSTVLFLNTRRMLISNSFKESVRRGLNQVLRQAFNQNVSAQVSMLGLPAWSHWNSSPSKRIPPGCSSSGASVFKKPLRGKHWGFPMARRHRWHPLWAVKI